MRRPEVCCDVGGGPGVACAVAPLCGVALAKKVSAAGQGHDSSPIARGA